MKLKKGASAYPMPLHSWIEFAAINKGDLRKDPGAVRVRLMQVGLNDLMAKDSKIHGTPLYYAVHQSSAPLDAQIHFWPTPDAAYDVVIRYAPPLKEI